MINLNIFDINNIFFVFYDYQMSYLEFFGTIFTAWSVYLAAKNKVLTWPISILGIVLYGFLFYQIQLYSDLFEQVYYFLTAFWGWYLWSKTSKGKQTHLQITTSTKSQNIVGLLATLLATYLLYLFMANIHFIMPTLFTVPASFPLLDALTTALSFVATVYLAQRKIENWYYWIIVDLIGVWLYFQKDVYFLSLLYLAFLINAIYGYQKWRQEIHHDTNL